MKKLYNKKGKIHPSPPIISDHLAFLPATIFTLTAALSPEDREVLAYLISCSGSPASNFSGAAARKGAQKSSGIGGGGGGGGGGWSTGGSADHPPLFHCDCFRCYTSYWVRWDASPNRQLIHDIIDAFEDELSKMKKGKNKKDRKKKGFGGSSESSSSSSAEVAAPVDESTGGATAGGGGDGRDLDADDQVGGNGDQAPRDYHQHHHDAHVEEIEKGSSVRRFASFIGEKIWGVWG